MHRYLPLLSLVLAPAVVLVNGCKDDPPAPASAPSASVAPPKLQAGFGLGLRVPYPEPYRFTVATSNPSLHQLTIAHEKSPGVVAIHFNPQQPSAPIDLQSVAESTRLTMDPNGIIQPSTVKVGDQSYEARAVKSSSLGLVPITDVIAVVPIGARNYVVILHSADDDVLESSRMFAVVLGGLRAE